MKYFGHFRLKHTHTWSKNNYKNGRIVVLTSSNPETQTIDVQLIILF